MRRADLAHWSVRPHALERQALMGVSGNEIADTLCDPETDYPSPRSYNLPGEKRRVATRGRLAVVYEPHMRQIITLLWNRAEGRNDEGQPA